jgi:nucleoside-diphosphate-sugar epimerase
VVSKILITGASGFIGTNLVEFYFNKGFDVYNLDYVEPRNKGHIKFWRNVDITDFDGMKAAFEDISPDYVIHLAARTELNEVKGLDYYSANTCGVENIIKLCTKNSGVKRLIMASSMLVNQVGYRPINNYDYNPSTLYGQSKVFGEEIVLANKDILTEFCIIRPTSIWGEWFSAPYRLFFDIILSGRYFHLGSRAATKTYGYVGNAVQQIDCLLFSNHHMIDGKVFYIGDKPAINISKWADEISELAGLGKAKKIPFIFFVIAGWIGDVLNVVGIKFPMSSFRLRNMTTDHIVNLDDIYSLYNSEPISRVDGIKRTLKWMSDERVYTN